MMIFAVWVKSKLKEEENCCIIFTVWAAGYRNPFSPCFWSFFEFEKIRRGLQMGVAKGSLKRVSGGCMVSAHLPCPVAVLFHLFSNRVAESLVIVLVSPSSMLFWQTSVM